MTFAFVISMMCGTGSAGNRRAGCAGRLFDYSGRRYRPNFTFILRVKSGRHSRPYGRLRGFVSRYCSQAAD